MRSVLDTANPVETRLGGRIGLCGMTIMPSSGVRSHRILGRGLLRPSVAGLPDGGKPTV